MKSDREMKLECIKLANALACGKNIPPSMVIETAKAYFEWVNHFEGPAR